MIKKGVFHAEKRFILRLFLILPVLILMVLISPATHAAHGKSKKELKANELKPLGRYEVKEGRLELIGSAVHFGVSFEGKQCVLSVSLNEGQDHNYIQYELDGTYQKRIKVQGAALSTLIIPASTSGKHTLWIYKATEAHTGPVFVHKLQAENLIALSIPKRKLIEFIGNSITCGAASDDSEVPCGQGEYHDQHNAYQAYGPRLARMLGVNYFLSSVSGYGMYRNWNSEGPTLPQVYDKLDLQGNSSRIWEVSTYSPQVISIALGTNDFSDGDGKSARAPFDADKYISAYVAFVKKLRSAHPKASIVLLNSPTVGGAREEVFKQCLNSIKEQVDKAFPSRKPIYVYFFKSGSVGGCSGHPDLKDHEMMARQLLEFFNKILK